MSGKERIIWYVKPKTGWNALDKILEFNAHITPDMALSPFKSLGYTVNVVDGCTQAKFIELLKRNDTYGVVIASHGDPGGFKGIHLDKPGGGATILEPKEIPATGIGSNLRFMVVYGCQIDSIKGKYAKALGLPDNAVYAEKGLSADDVASWPYKQAGVQQGDVIGFSGLPQLLLKVFEDDKAGRSRTPRGDSRDATGPDAGPSPGPGATPKDAGAPAGGVGPGPATLPPPGFVRDLLDDASGDGSGDVDATDLLRMEHELLNRAAGQSALPQAADLDNAWLLGDSDVAGNRDRLAGGGQGNGSGVWDGAPGTVPDGDALAALWDAGTAGAAGDAGTGQDDPPEGNEAPDVDDDVPPPGTRS